VTFLQAAIMGLMQGLTEFLPVSSKTHLLFTSHFLHLHLTEAQNLAFDMLLHFATALAVIIYFRKDIRLLLRGLGRLVIKPLVTWRDDPQARLAVYLLVATIPAGIVGLTLEKRIAAALLNIPMAAALLFVTAAFLFWISRRPAGGRTVEQATWLDALIIGACQACAVLPGISRSGATITGGLWRGLDRDAAPRFSFLLALPVILAGGLLNVKHLLGGEGAGAVSVAILLVGFLTAAVSGYLAIVLLMDIVRKGRLAIFAWYCAALGGAMLIYWSTLVPQLAPEGIVGIESRSLQPIAAIHDGELDGAELGQHLLFNVKTEPGRIPVAGVTMILPGQGDATCSVELLPKGPDAFVSSLPYPVALSGHEEVVPEDGELRDIMLIVRNAWGIENQIMLKMRVMPESLDRRRAALPH
jgi:undecaprenyl-diphosphatase